RSAECLGEAGKKRQAEDLPDADEVESDESGEQEGCAHLHALREQQHLAALDAVRHHAADQRKQKNRNAAEKGVQAKQKRRVGKLQDQPALSGNLHPGPDAGRAGAHPHQAEIPILKSFEGPADHDWVLFGKAKMPSGHELDCTSLGTDKTAMDFRRLLPEIRWQSCLSPDSGRSGQLPCSILTASDTHSESTRTSHVARLPSESGAQPD